MTTIEVLPADVPQLRALQLAIAAYLARYRASSRHHAESDLRAYLAWCADRQVDPLAASRPQVELYVRWMQEIRRLRPSTVSRRMSIVAGFYRTAVIDGVLEHSPAEHVRRPTVPAESPTLRLTHLQLEALLTAARQSPNQADFALVCLLGLLGLRIFEATGVTVADVGEEHGHRVLRVLGKAASPSWCRFRLRWAVRSTAPSTAAPADRFCPMQCSLPVRAAGPRADQDKGRGFGPSSGTARPDPSR